MPESAKVPGGRSPVRFSRIEQPRTHVFIAEQLRREITLGVLPTGEALPPERELAAMFGVARATVQQAVRILESEGLVRTRRGRGGGTSITGPPSDSVSRHRLIDPGKTHVCLEVDDLDGLLAKLHAAGIRSAHPAPVEIPRGDWRGFRDVYVYAPDEVVVELVERPAD